MINQVGFIARDVYRFLNEQQEASVIVVKHRLNISSTLVYMAIGWLMREGKIYVKKDGDSFLVGVVSPEIVHDGQ